MEYGGESPQEQGRRDEETLREVLDTISKFLHDIKDLIKDVIETLTAGYDGAKLGRELAEFYRSLVEAGVPEEEALAMMKDYYEKKMNALPSMKDLLKPIATFIEREVIGEEKRGEETGKTGE